MTTLGLFIYPEKAGPDKINVVPSYNYVSSVWTKIESYVHATTFRYPKPKQDFTWFDCLVVTSLRGYCTPDQFFDCLCIFLKNYNTLVASKICFL